MVLSSSEKVQVNQMLDMLVAIQDRDGAPGFMSIDQICLALNSTVDQLTKLLQAMEAGHLVQIDWTGRTVFLKREGYLIARPEEQTFPMPKIEK